MLRVRLSAHKKLTPLDEVRSDTVQNATTSSGSVRHLLENDLQARRLAGRIAWMVYILTQGLNTGGSQSLFYLTHTIVL